MPLFYTTLQRTPNVTFTVALLCQGELHKIQTHLLTLRPLDSGLAKWEIIHGESGPSTSKTDEHFLMGSMALPLPSIYLHRSILH